MCTWQSAVGAERSTTGDTVIAGLSTGSARGANQLDSPILRPYAVRPQPFYLGVAFALAGLLLSALFVRETRHHASHESALAGLPVSGHVPGPREVFWRTTLLNADLSSASQAGLVNNLNDGMAWGLFPLVFAAAGMNLAQIGLLAAIYPATWSVVQLATGALSDRTGRKPLIVWGMWIQAAGIVVMTLGSTFAVFVAGAVLLGIIEVTTGVAVLARGRRITGKQTGRPGTMMALQTQSDIRFARS